MEAVCQYFLQVHCLSNTAVSSPGDLGRCSWEQSEGNKTKQKQNPSYSVSFQLQGKPYNTDLPLPLALPSEGLK